VRESFRAYKNYVKEKGSEPRLPGLEKFSPEQLFFLSYAKVWCSKQTKQSLEQQILNGPHSPARYRVIGPLSNSVDFVNEFYCPVGEMNRSKKCVIW
jgi:predicted metalloendopeptidase